MKQNNLLNEQFNRLTVVAIYGKCKKQNVLWLCRCSCGGQAIAYAYDLRAGKVKSCGCLTKEGNHKTHGMTKTKEYAIWATMVQRCTNPNDINYHNYGGRGIDLDIRWCAFENFYADMGAKPDGMTLDRLDNAKGYSKENCAWRSYVEQSRNRRNNVFVVVDGTRMILVDALKFVKCTIGALHYRMRKYSMTHQEAIDLWQQQKNIS
jgi:hypothetical protein